MNKRRWGQWILLAVVCLSFSIGESYAQKNDFAIYVVIQKIMLHFHKRQRKTNGLFLWEIPLRKDG